MRVLLVDDNEELRDFLVATLKENAVDAIAAGSREEALRLAEQESFDAFVVDYVMGEIDGVTLVQDLRGVKTGRSIPAVLMSSISTHLARRMAQNANCILLVKPFGPTQFVDQIRDLR